MYYSKIRVDPTDTRRVYMLGGPFYVSDDSGATFAPNTDMTPSYDVGVHGDHHALWIDPANSQHLILGGDGGLYVSWDASRTWDKIDNLPIAQFYDVGVDMQTPYWVYGGAQDTHSWAGPSATPKRIGIVNGDWVQTNFGDGMVQAPDPNDPGTFYNESQGGNISRVDLVTGDRRAIRPVPPNPPAAPDGAEAGDEAEALSTDLYRFNWMSPIVILPHDSARVYLGGNRLFISDERGESWTPTRDLTRGEDRSELEIMGTVPDENTLSRNDGTSQWGTITTISESTREPGVIWAGTDDGLVQLSRDGGDTWTRIGTGSVAGGDTTTFAGLDPFRTLVTRVVASHHATGRAYVTFDRHRLDDFAPYVFVTEDFGASWRPLSTGFPSDEVIGWVNAFAEHPKSPNLLLAGTETGLFVSTDRGTSWSRMRGARSPSGYRIDARWVEAASWRRRRCRRDWRPTTA